MQIRIVATWAACAWLACAGLAYAQQGAAPASVAGTVTDPSGAVVPSAVVEISNVETGEIRRAQADAQGRFRILNLPVGAYELVARAAGFADVRVPLTLAVGDAIALPIRVAIAGGVAAVQVTASAPALDARRVPIADTIMPAEIDSLPLNGRNYLDLALLAPNVSRTNTRSSERFAETSAVPGTGISVAGQRNLNNTFIVDGLSANDDAADLAGTAFAEDVIREFQVITTGATAEFGRASAGVVNIVTNSGTNERRGRVYGFFRNERWDARNALATRKDPLSQSQYGVSAGGPLRRDRTFWFGNAERTEQQKNGVVTIARADDAVINDVLTRAGYRAPLVTTGEFRAGYDTLNLFGRVDQVTGEGGRLVARYSFYTVDAPNARGVGGLNAVSRGTPLEDTDQTLAGTWLSSGAGRWVNDARAQWTRSRLDAPPTDALGPSVTISGIASFGSSSSSPTRRDLDVLQIADTVTRQQGRHLVKLGADLLYNQVAIDFPGALTGSYTFTSLANFQRGQYQQYQQAFGEITVEQRNPNLALFAQDEWSVSPALTVTGGLRYDLQWLPRPIALDTNNVSPRLGLAWSAPGRVVVRANAGVYFDRVPLRATSNALQRDGIRYRTAVLSFGQEHAPMFPATLPEYPDGVLTAVTTIDPAIANARSLQFGVQGERALARDVTASVTYSRLRGSGLIMQRNVNVPTLTAAQAAALGIPNLGRPDSRFGNISRYEAIGDSWSNAMTLALSLRQSPAGRVRLSYTWSRSLDTAGNAFFNTPQDNFDIAAEKGPSDNDQRHRLSLSGAIGGDRGRLARMLGGFQLAYVLAAASGVPFNIVAGSDLNNDTTNNDRPAGVGRNSGRQPATATLDLRLSRAFAIGRQRVEVLAEAFNVTNRTNILAVNNTFGTGTTPLAAFGRPTLAGDPRQLQIGLRWSY